MNLMKLEMMNGTERIAEALQTRGLFTEVKEDFIVLDIKNTEEDVLLVQQLLSKLNIPTLWSKNENKFQVLVNRIPVSLMKKVMNTPGAEFPVSMSGHHFKWRSFAQRRFGIKLNALNLDPQIAMFVKSLNLAGITSLAGCNGHYRYEPNVQLSGVFQGAWFEVIQEKFLSECDLHYNWNVRYGNQSGSCIVAERGENRRFNMNLIFQDAVQMAEILQKHSEEIRAIKINTFKRNKNMKGEANIWQEEHDYEGLVEWMMRKVEESSSRKLQETK